MKIACFFSVLLCCIFISSCKTEHATHPTSIEQIQTTLQESIDIDRELEERKHRFRQPLPSNVNAALLPPLSHYISEVHEEPPRFDVTANNVPAHDFFMGLVAGTRLNMVMDPNVRGTISLTLKNVTLKQTMEAVRDIYGYDYHRTSYGYEVLSPRLESQLFHVNYLDVQRSGKSYTQLTTGQVSNKVGTVTLGGAGGYAPAAIATQGPPEGLGTISSIETRSEMRFWRDLERTIINMVGKEEGHSVNVNALSGVIAVRAFPGELHRVARYINTLQKSLNRQVILEAKILEVQLNDEFQSGIDWSILSNPAAINPNTGLPFPDAGIGQAGDKGFADTDLKPLGLDAMFAFRVKGNFKLLVELLQTQGNVQVLSSPHISTVNNQKAVIKVGQDEFFVTGVSTSNTIIGTNTIPSQDVSLTPFFSGVTLDVTPEISSDDTVVLHIHPSVSKVTEQIKVIGLGSSSAGTANNLTLPLAKSTIRESDTIVRAKNGQVVVIGGLMENNQTETLAETPGVSKIPFIGTFFRRTKQNSNKSELIILLRPIVATNKTFINKMEEERTIFEVNRRPFHVGGLPKVFGNEAEQYDNE